MELLYKPDWEKTKQNYLSWWNGEDFGRCGLAIAAPKALSKPPAPPKLPEKIEDRWLDLDYLHSINEYRMSVTYYGGEAIPVWTAAYPGWCCVSSFVGSEVELMEDTGWLNPTIEENDLTDYDYNKIKIEENNRWWLFAEVLHKFAANEAKGKSIPDIQALGAVGDSLAAIRSTNKLLFDCVECPDYVRDFDGHMMKLWEAAFDKFYNITHNGAEGSSNFMHMWAPGKFYIPQCDFAYMISQKMFNEIFLPNIIKQIDFLDYSLYHVDGEGNFKHVDALCEIKKLQTIQILPGAGKPSALHYMELLKKVQKSGKNLQIFIEPDEVEAALENLSSQGLFLIVTNCQTEEHARYLIKNAEKWSKVRKI